MAPDLSYQRGLTRKREAFINSHTGVQALVYVPLSNELALHGQIPLTYLDFFQIKISLLSAFCDAFSLFRGL